MRPDQRLKFNNALSNFAKKKAAEEVLLGNLELKGVVRALVQPIENDLKELTDSHKGLEGVFKSKTKLLDELARLLNDKEKDLKKEIKELKEEVERQKNRGTGASMYQDWGEDSTEEGTLSGDVNGVNTIFILRNRAVNKVVFLYRNGNLEKLTDYSVGADQKTITYSGFPPQTLDNIQAKYPR